jgi:hypothetical protein
MYIHPILLTISVFEGSVRDWGGQVFTGLDSGADFSLSKKLGVGYLVRAVKEIDG